MTSRRDFLQRFGSGFGMLGLASLLDQQGLLCPNATAASDLSLNPLAATGPFSRQGKTGDLAVHERGPEPGRHLGL